SYLIRLAQYKDAFPGSFPGGGLRRQDRTRRRCRAKPGPASEPVVEESIEPSRQRRIVAQESRFLHFARLRPRARQLLRHRIEPGARIGRSHFRMELEAIGRVAVAESLVRKGVALGQKLSTFGHREAFRMPVKDVQTVAEEGATGRRRAHRKIADLVAPLRVPGDRRAERAGQQLRAEADAEVAAAATHIVA